MTHSTGVGKPSFEVSALLVLAFFLVWFSLFSTSLQDHLLSLQALCSAWEEGSPCQLSVGLPGLGASSSSSKEWCLSWGVGSSDAITGMWCASVKWLKTNAVTNGTIAVWLTETLKLESIKASGGSTQKALASWAVSKGVSIKTILEARDWAHMSTTYRHYIQVLTWGYGTENCRANLRQCSRSPEVKKEVSVTW